MFMGASQAQKGPTKQGEHVLSLPGYRRDTCLVFGHESSGHPGTLAHETHMSQQQQQQQPPLSSSQAVTSSTSPASLALRTCPGTSQPSQTDQLSLETMNPSIHPVEGWSVAMYCNVKPTSIVSGVQAFVEQTLFLNVIMLVK